MAHALIRDGVVVHKIEIGKPRPGMIEVPDEVQCEWFAVESGGNWTFEAPPPPPPPREPTVAELLASDQGTLNDALTASGSIVRALGLVMFAEINKLRVRGGDPAYTLAQFKAALIAQMR